MTTTTHPAHFPAAGTDTVNHSAAQVAGRGTTVAAWVAVAVLFSTLSLVIF